MSGRPDPKPRKRIREGKTWWQKQQRRKAGRCSLCRRTTKTSWHHLVERSLGGDDLEVNLIELCGDGTRGCHGDVTMRLRDARARLRRILNAQQIGYIIERKGRDWIDTHYPKEPHV